MPHIPEPVVATLVLVGFLILILGFQGFTYFIGVRAPKNQTPENTPEITTHHTAWSIDRHPATNQWSFQMTSYDKEDEVIGFNFFPFSLAGLQAGIIHNEKIFDLPMSPTDKGRLKGLVLGLQKIDGSDTYYKTLAALQGAALSFFHCNTSAFLRGDTS